jgi:hypothetical protein
MGYVGVKPSAVPLTSADITDGIIVNADINASAAIALSKLATTGTLTVDNIQFPATAVASANANNLDDYEEGTWTPVIVASTNPTVVYDIQQGYYTKIGRNVVLSARIKTTSVSGGSGSVRLSGVPFTEADGNAPYENGGKVWSEQGSFLGEAPIDVRIVSTLAFLYYRGSVTDGETNFTVADLKTTAGNAFSFSINLRV